MMRARAALLLGAIALPVMALRAQEVPCVRVADLPAQQVADGERIVHLGLGPGWAGRELRLCPEREPVRRVRFRVRQANVVLDCGGVAFDGGPTEGLPAVRWALDVDRTAVPAVRHVTIRSCEFRNYARGMVLTGPDIADADPGRALVDFRVADTKVLGTGGVGIYVGAHARGFTLERLTIRDNRLTGIYLDAYSTRTTVARSTIANNGFSACHNGREGIAIDGSQGNIIVGNTFRNNRYAGVALYKNCGESGTPRTLGADRNLIAFNVFEGHRGAAVRIAARQGFDPANDDCVSATCSDPIVPGTTRYRDRASFNVVSHNRFVDNAIAVEVLDSDNHVQNNTFATTARDGASAQISVGSDLLEHLGRPVSGVTVANNRVVGDPTEVPVSATSHGAVLRQWGNVVVDAER